MDIIKYLDKKTEIVNKEIDKLITKKIEPERLKSACRHLFKAGGKRLRPALTLTAAQAVGGSEENAVECAASLEILHTFTLIHDDIMDRDECRRGSKTVHKIWDEPTAIIAGDALFAKVFEALNRNVKREKLSSKKIIQLLDTISKTSFKICQGQSLDMEFEERNRVTEPEYLEMVEKKTGVLFETSTKTGAILGGGSPEEVEALSKYGKVMGIAFQIHDDLLGLTGEQKKVGKPIGSDIKEGKWTFLTVHAYENASKEERNLLLNILGKGNAEDEEIKKIVEIFENTGTIEFTKEKSRTLVNEAKENLNLLPSSEAKEFLTELADFSIEREL